MQDGQLAQDIEHIRAAPQVAVGEPSAALQDIQQNVRCATSVPAGGPPHTLARHPRLWSVPRAVQRRLRRHAPAPHAPTRCRALPSRKRAASDFPRRLPRRLSGASTAGRPQARRRRPRLPRPPILPGRWPDLSPGASRHWTSQCAEHDRGQVRGQRPVRA